MSASPLVSSASARLARAYRAGLSADEVATAHADLEEAKAVQALDRADLTPERRERIAVALLTDSIEAWVTRTLDTAPAVSPETSARLARLLAEGEDHAVRVVHAFADNVHYETLCGLMSGFATGFASDWTCPKCRALAGV